MRLASMVRYCGHISRSLNHGLSSTSLVKSRVILLTRFAGFSTRLGLWLIAMTGSSLNVTASVSSKIAYIAPRESWPVTAKTVLPSTVPRIRPMASGAASSESPGTLENGLDMRMRGRPDNDAQVLPGSLFEGSNSENIEPTRSDGRFEFFYSPSYLGVSKNLSPRSVTIAR